MRFRSLPKVTLQAKIPPEVAEKVGLRALKERKPDNAVVTELLCLGLGLDPSKFGLAPKPKIPAKTSAN